MKAVKLIDTALSQPKIIYSVPMSGDVEVPLDSSLSFTFSRAMIRKSVEESFVISPEVQGQFIWDGNTLTFDPAEDFIRGQEITVAFSSNARAKNFIKLEKTAITFSTLSNPEISLASPTGNIAEPVKNIVVMFNKSVRRVDADILKVTPEVIGERKWIGSTAYVIKPQELIMGQKYTVELVEDLDSLDGGFLEKGYKFEFVNYAPAALHIDSGEESAGYYYALDNTDESPYGPVTIFFNQKINQKDVISRFVLKESLTGEEVSVRSVFVDRTKDDNRTYYYNDWQENWRQKVQIYPLVVLKPNTQYTASLNSGFSSETGNAVAESGIATSFKTASLPGFSGSSITNGEENVGDDKYMAFYFQSPMNREEIEKNLVINTSSETEGEYYMGLFDKDKTVRFNKYLTRSATYEFFLPASTKDKFGRPLGKDIRIKFSTAPHKPSYSLQPFGTYYANFSSNVDTRFIGRGVNISKLRYSLYKISLEQFVTLNNLDRGEWGKINDLQAHNLEYEYVGSWNQDFDLEENVYTDIIYNFNSDAQYDLSKGLYFVNVTVINNEGHESNINDNMVFSVGDVAAALKYSHSSLLVWATSLESREVKSGYSVNIYSLKSYPKDKTPTVVQNLSPLLSGTTNDDGVYFNTDTTIGRRTDPYFVVVQKQDDIGIVFNDSDLGISPYQFNDVAYSYSLMRDGPEKYKAFAFTDRTLYRPGENVHYKAFILENNLHTFSYPSEEKVIKVQLRELYDYEKKNIMSKDFENVVDGNIDGSFKLPQNIDLGRYAISVSIDGKEYYSTTFDVQEYVVPEFEVVIETPEREVIRGDRISLNSTAQYFYGAPVVEATADYRLYKRNYIYRWDEDRSYNFYSTLKYYEDDDIWRGFEEKEVLETSGNTDKSGKITINPSTVTTSGVSEIYTFETEVQADSGRKLAGSDEYVVHMAEYYTGIKPKSYVGIADESSFFEVKTVTPEGRDKSGIEVGFSVYKRNYYRIKNKDNSEGYLYNISFEDVLVDTGTLRTNAKGEGEFSFIPQEGGLHIIVVESPDSKGNLSTADTRLYVGSSKHSGYWKRENHDRVELILDKPDYKIGEKATIVATSTLENTVGLLTTEAEDIIDYKIFTQASSGDTIELDIKETYAPNVYVSALFNQPGISVYEPAEFKMGVAKLNVDISDKELDLEFHTNEDTYNPGESGKATIAVKDQAGNPVPNAILTVAIVDDALLTMSPIKMKDIFSHFYSGRSLGVRTGHSVTHLLDRINANTEIGAKGGSGSKGGAGGDYKDLTREDFSVTAKWVGTLRTDEYGGATVSFTLPDSTTRWNLYAVAQDSSGSKYGQGSYTFGSSLEIFGSPSHPRFARVEDKFNLGLVIHNNSYEDKDFRVNLSTDNLELQDTNMSKDVTVPINDQVKVVFPVVAGNEGTASFTFTLYENDIPLDAIKKSISILPYGLEIVDSVSNVVNYESVEEMYVDSGVNKNYGGLTAELYSTYIGIADNRLNELIKSTRYSHNYTENVSSEIMALVYKHVYEKKVNDNDDQYSKNRIDTGIINLTSMQHTNGGWGYGQNAQTEDILNTTIALEALTEAERAGFNVDLEAINNGINYIQGELLKTQLNNDKLSHTVYVLELGKSNQAGRIQNLYTQRHTLSDYSKAYLIMAMRENPAKWDKFENQLMSELGEKADLGSQRAFWNRPTGIWFCYNDISVTSAVLRALNKISPRSPLANLAVRHIVQNTQNMYLTSYVNQISAVALYENAIQKGIKPRDTTVELSINDNIVGTGDLKKNDVNSKFTQFVPVNELADGNNKLGFNLVNGGDSYYNFVLRTLMPFEKVESNSSEIGLLREFLDFDGNILEGNQFEVGETYIVRLTIASPNIRKSLVLEDYLPAGFESVNGTLKNESGLSGLRAGRASEETSEARSLWSSDVQLRDDRTEIYINYLGGGLYEYTYVVRATIPGTYKLRPAQIYEKYSPDIRANTVGGLIKVVE